MRVPAHKAIPLGALPSILQPVGGHLQMGLEELAPWLFRSE
jgi:hypothetical protein